MSKRANALYIALVIAFGLVLNIALMLVLAAGAGG
jgi:hypothetical protein